MTTNPYEQFMQAFRTRKTDEVVKITARKDSKSGKHIVLWNDIVNVFKNADYVIEGESAVPFLTDGNFEQIMPPRIAYRPGVVLDVVLEGRSPVDSTTTLVSLPPAGGKRYDDEFRMPSAECNTDLNALAQTIAALAVADNNVMCSTCIGPEESLISPNQVNSPCMQAIEAQTLTFKLLLEIMNEKQDQILQKQQHTLDRLAIIQSRLQALLTQTYELHEYPIPRLFIVLPKVDRSLNKLRSFFSVSYRLYFLCECGTHTMAEHSKKPPVIHLAKHEGYDLDKPSEFFERYGSYVLAMMYMVKFGISVAGLAIPPLASLKILEGLETAQDDAQYLKGNIGALVDETIKALQDFKSNHETGTELVTEYAAFDKLEALEGADLRQLESHLKVKDQNRVLGNMYRIVTPEGHVKWVCLDHYRTNYKESVMQQLQDVVKVNGGRFTEETGKIKVKVGSNILAKQFYDAMVKARGIQELEITLEWAATMDDLRSLSKAVTKANVIRLTLDGTHFKGSNFDVINRTRRFDPILKLTSNTRIQSLQLQGFDNFFSRVSTSAMPPSPKIRVFSIQSGVKDIAKFFNSHMERFSALTKLELKLRHPYSIEKAITEILSKFNKLKSLKVDCGDISISTMVLQGKIQEMKATIKQMNGLSSDDFRFIQDGHLGQLAIKYTIEKTYESQLTDILRRAPNLKHLQIGCRAERFLTITNLVTSTRATIVQEIGSSCLQTIELMEETLIPFDTLGECDRRRTCMHSVLVFIEDSDSFDMRTWIRLRKDMSIIVENNVYAFIRQHGWSIVFFDEYGSRNHTFAAILDDISTTRESQLESFRFDSRTFTSDGFDRLDNIMKRSPNFKDLGLYIYFYVDSDLDNAWSLLSRYGSILSVLRLDGSSLEKWMPLITSSFPTRNSFPNLVSLDLRFLDSSNLPLNCVSWIAAMVSAPPQAPSQSLRSQPFRQNSADTLDAQSESTMSWSAPRKIALQKIKLQPEEWKVLVDAIDFSELQHLNLFSSNISPASFKLLVGRIPDDSISKVPFKTLKLNATKLSKSSDSRVVLAELRKKVPLAEIIVS